MTKTLITMLIVVCVCFLAITATAGPKKGGTLRVGVPADAVGLDPHKTRAYGSALMLKTIYEEIVTLSQDEKVMPGLAKSWTISDDGLVYTFKLREGVKFHNGREMSAEDVKYSYERLLDPKTKAPRLGPVKKIKDIKVLDKYTVQFTLKKATAAFLILNANPARIFAIVPREEVEKQNDTLNIPVGTGPYKFVEYSPDQHFIVERFEKYKQPDIPNSGAGGYQPSYVDRIKYIPIKEATVRDIALKKGEIDFSTRISFDQWDEMKTAKGIRIISGPHSSIVALTFGIKNNPLFQNKAFRQAIAYSLDKQAVLDGSVWGHGKINPSLVAKKLPFYSEVHKKGYPRDLKKVKTLLKKAGYKGQEVKILVAKRYPMTYKAAIVVQQQLQEAGINAKLDVKEWAALLKDAKSWQYDICSFIFGSSVDPAKPMRHLKPTGYSGYDNPKILKLIEEGDSVSDFETRKKIYEQIHEIMLEDVPMVKFYDLDTGFGYQTYVKGVLANDKVGYTLTKYWLEK